MNIANESKPTDWVQNQLGNGLPGAGFESRPSTMHAKDHSGTQKDEGGAAELVLRLEADTLNSSTFDVERGHAILQSGARIKVRPDLLRGGDGTDVFLPARMSGIPWTLLESFYRAFWIVLSAALGVTREAVEYASGERISGNYLYSAASYRLSTEDVAKLADANVRRRVEVGIALLGEGHLWVSADLPSRYPGTPWQEMLAACQQARDEIRAKRLPCQVAIELQPAGLSLTVAPDLAPPRPAKVDRRQVTEVGHSNGYRYRYDHRLYFAKDDGKPPWEIHFPEEKFLDQVIAVSGADAPWIEVNYEEERHDGVVVSRLMLSLKVKNDSLLSTSQTC